MNKMYGFEGEVKAKYDEQTMELFSEVFQALPLGATIGGKVLVVHGGLFGKDGVSLGACARACWRGALVRGGGCRGWV